MCQATYLIFFNVSDSFISSWLDCGVCGSYSSSLVWSPTPPTALRSLPSGKINKPDQILPFLVTDKLGHIPALSGLFVAAVYGGVLSTLSSCGNSAACMVWEDFLKPLPFFSKLSDKSATLVVKILSSFTGVLSVVLAWSWAASATSSMSSSASPAAKRGPL
ncbi:Sodium-coupled monocarboxylate transporter 1 [Chionoecetes opilio]|uniref:Sodium-coupled monocarboxylate transporter 1 n=1 Tax=Chionoecetes opilio TaxID=41210 RepID=A0A8J4YUX4_CHIOP|nr:Sodium-coupled monocarboxylate transporter 1 [Chionoecetes opilio]KAG0727604.1 Sodium-coupled monocarboxylate transporter 1 [Chionoecetes opilio]